MGQKSVVQELNASTPKKLEASDAERLGRGSCSTKEEKSLKNSSYRYWVRERQDDLKCFQDNKPTKVENAA